MKQQQERQEQQQQEQQKQLEIEQQQISKNRKNVSTAQRDKDKRKKKVQYVSIGTSGESRKSSKDQEKFGTEVGMQMIAGQFGDSWHKLITRCFGVQRIVALFRDAVP